MAIEVLCLMKVCQVLVVGEDLDGEGGSVEVVSPGFQSMDDCKELLVIDVVVSFSRDERLGKVGTGMPVAVSVHLEEDGTWHRIFSISYSSSPSIKLGGGAGEFWPWISFSQ